MKLIMKLRTNVCGSHKFVVVMVSGNNGERRGYRRVVIMGISGDPHQMSPTYPLRNVPGPAYCERQ